MRMPFAGGRRMLSVLDLFRIGIGPSSSHTVGPMRIARRFVDLLERADEIGRIARVRVVLAGSLALTGEGHGSPRAALLGLAGQDPGAFDPDEAVRIEARAAQDSTLALGGRWPIGFERERDIHLDFERMPDLHPNAMTVEAYDSAGVLVRAEEFFSTGGGFIASRRQLERPAEDDRVRVGPPAPATFASGAELLARCAERTASISDIVLANEDAARPRAETLAGLDAIGRAMFDCIARGLVTNGVLPGRLGVRRRAPELWSRLASGAGRNDREALFDTLNAYAMAVNEENAAGGRVVTAPTNGAAGIIPALIRYYCVDDAAPEVAAERVRTFLLTAGGVGLLYKQRASISGAEMGCQGEVGVACSMGAAGLAAIWGATPLQACAAAEIGMEHNLGLTCDPVAGLVQIPCIERNAIGAVKAANAARLALAGNGATKVSLDQVIETMRQTGLDMSTKYKETSLGGLAVNVVEC
jgi:L-serine dehydratase